MENKLHKTLYELGFLDKNGNREKDMDRRWRVNVNEAELILKDFMKDIADLVKKDIDARKKMGIKKYGVPLRANNGRDALQDAYEEALDLAHYLKQAMVERDGEAWEVTPEELAHIKKELKHRALKRKKLQ